MGPTYRMVYPQSNKFLMEINSSCYELKISVHQKQGLAAILFLAVFIWQLHNLYIKNSQLRPIDLACVTCYTGNEYPQFSRADISLITSMRSHDAPTSITFSTPVLTINPC